MKFTIVFTLAFRLSGVLLLLLFCFSPASAQSTVPKLFKDAPAFAGNMDSQRGLEVVRQRAVVVDLGMLEQVRPAAAAATGQRGDYSYGDQDVASAVAAPSKLQLDLFDGDRADVEIGRIEGRTSGSRVWFGQVEGVADSEVTLVVKEGVMVGNIAFSNRFYQIRFAGNGIHVLKEIDQSVFKEVEPTPVNNAPDPQTDTRTMSLDSADYLAAADSNQADGRETNKIIDILVVYTPAAKTQVGGTTTAMENLIDLAIAETNTGYANSGINQRLNLVHTEQVIYAESGTSSTNMATDRDRLRIKNDGFIDNVHALRDSHNADVVTMITHSYNGWCGIAYIMETVAHSFEEFGFNVTAHDCATGYYSFGHELGHIMGARHNWGTDNTDNSPYTYNHGYGNGAEDKRSVMAYAAACGTGTCIRQNWWSNPHNGPVSPWGVPEGTANAADNRKTLNNTGFTVANFRVRDDVVGPSKEISAGILATNGQSGVMFDLKAKKDTTIHGFSNIFGSAGTSSAEIYYREGSYVGFLNNPSAWKLVGSINDFATNAYPASTHIPIDMNISIPADQTYAFHIFTNTTTRYQNGSAEGAVLASNDQLELYEGRGCTAALSCAFVPRAFPGTIHYSYADQITDFSTTSDPGSAWDGFMFDVKAKHNITVHGFSPFLRSFSNAWNKQIEVYYRPGSHVGFETSMVGWTKIGPVDNVLAWSSTSLWHPTGGFSRSMIPLEMSIPILSGETYAFYITNTSTSDELLYGGASAPIGSANNSNAHMDILAGKGMTYPFVVAWAPRAFAGTVHYSYNSEFCLPIKTKAGKIAVFCL